MHLLDKYNKISVYNFALCCDSVT